MCVYAECWNVDETGSLLGVWSYGNMKKKNICTVDYSLD